MQKSIRVLGALALIGAGIWLWLVFFPSPEKAIRARLKNLAKSVSFEPQDGMISRGYHAEKAAGFFSVDCELKIEARGYEPLHVNGRDELTQLALLGARQLKGLHVEFLDINVTLEPDKQRAKANLTGRWTISGTRDFDVMEFNFYLKKVDRDWLIYRVETVKTLSFKPIPAA